MPHFILIQTAGTPLGDPIEVGALVAAFTSPSSRSQSASSPRVLSLASVKSCYGHTEGAAGITGLLLAAAATHQQCIPPVVNLRNLNPYVEAALSVHGTAIPRQSGPRPSARFSLAAGTSSFGMSGVNAHMLMEPASHHADLPPESMPPAAWELSRFWPFPQQHRLLQLPLLTGRSVHFSVAISATPALAFLWQHLVNSAQGW